MPTENDQNPAVEPHTEKLIDLTDTLNRPFIRRVSSGLNLILERVLRIRDLNRVNADIQADGRDLEFFQRTLIHLNIQTEVSAEDMSRIPRKGPLMVVANHPFGGLEGVILGALMNQVRPDCKIMGNYLLRHIEEIRDRIIPVDPFGGPNAQRENSKGLKAVIRWLREGGAVIVFPAGEVSHLRLRRGIVTDSDWSPHLGGLLRRTQTTVLPVYFPGRNSAFFQLAGLVHPLVRTALLPRELLNKSGKTLRLFIGNPIHRRRLSEFDTDAALVSYIRNNTYFMKNREVEPQPRLQPPIISCSRQKDPRPVAPPLPKDLLESEIHRLPHTDKLFENEEYTVYLSTADRIPNVLREIGRCRELTFRGVDEGTGREVDLDRFDTYYRHLFLWSRRNRELVGAYRLGLTDEILKTRGSEGLYTSTLFRFKPAFLERLHHSIEFGRSFIRTEYQKQYNSLVFLWRGIGEYIGQNRNIKTLFGPVSISRDYHAVSRNLMVRFLKMKRTHPTLARFVSPRRPFRTGRVRGLDRNFIRSSLRDIDDISLLISEIEKDGKGIPILLRHYLKLNARLVSFNVDRDFASVVDGLILVDLTETDPRLLKRFMGDHAAGYMAHHGLPAGGEKNRFRESA